MVIIVHNLQVVPIISDQWTKCMKNKGLLFCNQVVGYILMLAAKYLD